MSNPLPKAAAARLLFETCCPPAVADDIEWAIATAGGRWPVLQPALKAAAELVRADSVYEAPAEAHDLALVKPPAAWTFLALSPTPTGLACTGNDWSPTTRGGPGDGLYCADILAYLLALYLEQPLAPLPYAPEELWELTLQELRLQMTRASFNQWLHGSRVIREASTPLSLTVAVRNPYVQEWLTHRLHSLIVSALTSAAGYGVQVRFFAS
jgi:hypothetical protein